MIEDLTPYQRYLCILLLKGHSNAEIAEITHSHISTIKQRFERLFRGFNITSGNKRVKLAILLYNLQQSN